LLIIGGFSCGCCSGFSCSQGCKAGLFGSKSDFFGLSSGFGSLGLLDECIFADGLAHSSAHKAC
jgi:hypothetical protein